jgi:TM2 domain-containing membrane protein YozV
MPITCERCGTANRDNSPNCINCGSPLSIRPDRESAPPPPVTYQKQCINCHQLINSSLMTCPYCGANQMAGAFGTPFSTPINAQHNKLVAGLLAIFLGSFGVHKFYLGQMMAGIIYLIFCWTGIPGIIGIIEGIMYLSMADPAFYQKYG